MKLKELLPLLPKLKKDYEGRCAGSLRGNVSIWVEDSYLPIIQVENYLENEIINIDVTNPPGFPKILIYLKELK